MKDFVLHGLFKPVGRVNYVRPVNITQYFTRLDILFTVARVFPRAARYVASNNGCGPLPRKVWTVVLSKKMPFKNKGFFQNTILFSYILVHKYRNVRNNESVRKKEKYFR
jgi:hypothetical protein